MQETKFKCVATDCFFHGIWRGEFDCDMKNVFIIKSGRCEQYIPKEEGEKFIKKNWAE